MGMSFVNLQNHRYLSVNDLVVLFSPNDLLGRGERVEKDHEVPQVTPLPAAMNKMMGLAVEKDDFTRISLPHWVQSLLDAMGAYLREQEHTD